MSFVCDECPRACSVVRGDEKPGAGAGRCRMGENIAVARMAPHFDEEPCISGARGSGAVFFSGCSLMCVYCQNEEVSRGCFGAQMTDQAFMRGLDRLIAQGVHNINFVSPTHFSHKLIKILNEKKLPVPVIWNSGGYEKAETIQKLDGLVDVYLPDLKYIDEAGARAYSAAPDYFDFASRAILAMRSQVGPVQIGDDGLMKKGVMIRHLLLPGRVKESMRALDWIADNLSGVWVSLMAQYLPCGIAKHIEALNRTVAPREYDQVVNHLFKRGLEDGYVQELSSADEKFIPAFDLTGVEG